MVGLHKSPYHGFSVEFAEHRQYMPGDPIRHIDWKVFGKTDRFYIKEFEADTNLRLCLVVDTSGSMAFGDDKSSKLDYAKHLAGQYEPVDVTGIQHALGAVIIVVLTLFVEGGPRSEPAAAWTALGYMALFSSFVPMMLYYWMLRHVSATYAALAGYIVPPIAITAGVLVLDERLQPGIILGGILILVGVILADRAERRPPVPVTID